MFGEISPKVPGLYNANGSWLPYTPVWTSAGTQPTLGNGTLTGFYIKMGRTIHFRISLLMGSTTTFGTGDYTLSLPFTVSSNTALKTPVGLGYTEQAGIQGIQLFGRLDNLTTVAIFGPNGVADTRAAGVNSTKPFTYAANDFIRVAGTYESAT